MFDRLPPARLSLRPSSFMNRGVVLSLVASLSLIVFAMTSIGAQSTQLKTVLVGVLLAVASILFRSLRRAETLPDIELHDDVMVLPLRADQSETRVVQYEALRAAFSRGRPPRDEVVLEAAGHTYVYPRQIFDDEDGLDIFFVQLRSRLRRHPRGAQIIAEIRHRENVTRRLFRVRPRVTYSLIGLIVSVFLLQVMLGGRGDPIVSARLGANLFERTLSGEWYRLFTANFIHGGRLHIYLNGLALFSLGGALERLLGHWTYLTVFLLAGVGGALASALVNVGPMSVGASTALFGLFGALAVLHVAHRQELPMAFRQSGRWWIIIVGLNTALAIWFPVVDVAAHLGGFIVGSIVAYLALRWRGGLGARYDRKLRTTGLAITAVYLVAFTQGAVNAARFDARDRAMYADQIFNPRLRAEIEALDAEPSREQAFRLASVLAQSVASRGSVWRGGEPVALEARIEGDVLHIDSEIRTPDGASLFFVAHRDGQLRGLLRVELAGATSGRWQVQIDESADSQAGKLVLGLADLNPPGTMPSASSARYWSLPNTPLASADTEERDVFQ